MHLKTGIFTECIQAWCVLRRFCPSICLSVCLSQSLSVTQNRNVLSSRLNWPSLTAGWQVLLWDFRDVKSRVAALLQVLYKVDRGNFWVATRGAGGGSKFEIPLDRSFFLRPIQYIPPTSFNCLSPACRACDYVYIDYVRRSRSSSCRLLRPINCQTYITLHIHASCHRHRSSGLGAL